MAFIARDLNRPASRRLCWTVLQPSSRFFSLWIFSFCLASVVVLQGRCVSAASPFDVYDLEMHSRPQLPDGPLVYTFPDGLLEVWSKAVDRPDPELQRMVIDSIVIANRRGMPNIESMRDKLTEQLRKPKQDLTVLIATAGALIAFDQSDMAEELANLAQQRGKRLQRVVEPALIDWKSNAVDKLWLSRLKQTTVSDEMLELAIKGVAATGNSSAADDLESLVRAPERSFGVRLQAAGSLGALDETRSLKIAREISGANDTREPLRSLMAVALLNNRRDSQSVEFLKRLAHHPNSVVQSESLRRLFEIDPQIANSMTDELVGSRDVNVRRLCARSMLAKQAPSRIKRITPLLADINPGLRHWVANELVSWAKNPKLKDEVINQTTKVLEKDSWQGCEQASYVLGTLGHKPAGERMVQLLKHPRGEVKVASAWGLTKLRETKYFPAMLAHAESVYQGFRSGELNDGMPGASLQMAHLFIAFGDQKFAPAEDIIRAYLPKSMLLGDEARGAACWSIGMLYADRKSPPDLVKLLRERLVDGNSEEPESGLVCQMCAITLGRMKAKSALPDLRELASPTDTFGRSCHWAIEQMTGEKSPPVTEKYIRYNDWFLAPLTDSELSPR